jgi:hypothetical protein
MILINFAEDQGSKMSRAGSGAGARDAISPWERHPFRRFPEGETLSSDHALMMFVQRLYDRRNPMAINTKNKYPADKTGTKYSEFRNTKRTPPGKARTERHTSNTGQDSGKNG